jgi:hypothetical protein
LDFNDNTTQSKTTQSNPSLFTFEQPIITQQTNNQTTNLLGNDNLWDTSTDDKQSGFTFINPKVSNTNLMNMTENSVTQQSELASNIFKVYSGSETTQQQPVQNTQQQKINYINFNQPQINIQNTYMNNNQHNGYMNQHHNYGYNMQRQHNMQHGYMNQNDLLYKQDTNSYRAPSTTSNNAFNLDLGTQKKKTDDPFQNLYTFK